MRLRFLFAFFVFSFVFANAQIVNIPDPILKDALLNYAPAIDTNGDGEIQNTEAELITILNINQAAGDVTSIEGLDSFINLVELYLSDATFSNTLIFQNYINLERLQLGNVSFPELNLIDMSSLNRLDIINNENDNFTTLGFSDCNCNNFEELYLSTNLSLIDINISDIISLKTFDVFGSSISQVDIANNINLEIFRLFATNITELDFSSNPNMESLRIEDQVLNVLNVSECTNLETLVIDLVDMEILDLSNNNNLNYLDLDQDQGSIDFLNLKNNSPQPAIFRIDDLNIVYLCINDFQMDTITPDDFSNSTPIINSYCSFTPGGDYYVIEGSAFFDFDLDGCDVDDLSFPNLKFNIFDGSDTGTLIANSSGNYSIPLPEGTYTVTPVLSSNNFTVNPNTVSVIFPSENSPFNQDICINSNGNVNDLEISIIPDSQAVPGFNSSYRILYKNVGNAPISGFVEFDYIFDSDFMTYVSSTPTANSITDDLLSWDYENLIPFEIRQILITMNHNTPIDANFPLNSGDELNFSATVYPLVGDETPNNNDSGLKQIVVNSFDPNDITCLQGENITPDKVGEYVDYLIRFENLGTANATNIVVKNTIDISKFDINSLLPVNGSHDFYTRINAQNDVEFIFENINLPFDDANNDGYVLYKIKTLDALVLGDTFSNQAEIYFDFNAPIITNNYTTEISEEQLSTNEFSVLNTKIYPNPVNDVLTIESDAIIDSAILYDINGREILVSKFEGTNYQMDLSELKSGIYFLKVFSSSGNHTLKVLKQ
ncbi:T9SS type A sorting domain-containing protein [Psychroserpens sp. Hel_I_66]|uniref:T9SS type A sorting domain-containing protein n=1 Tax=Psychroserpens sp. Hel_I_66 TaxID=1250004 RepID=UPI00068FA810|nr:T9SS type A sorting domain-containing protein [Psychroserpens sp. Hel_I_66]